MTCCKRIWLRCVLIRDSTKITIIDVLSKYAWAVPLKSGNDVATVIAKIIRDGESCLKNLQTNGGKKFYNANM